MSGHFYYSSHSCTSDPRGRASEKGIILITLLENPLLMG